MTVNKSLYPNLTFDPAKDFEPITQLAQIIRSESGVWAKVIKSANIRAD